MSMVKCMKSSLNQHKVDISRWLYLNGITFNVLTSPEFWSIHYKHCDNYTALSWIKFSENVAHEYRRFVIACAKKLTRGIQQHHGELFLYVMHDMVTLNNRNITWGRLCHSWWILTCTYWPSHWFPIMWAIPVTTMQISFRKYWRRCSNWTFTD